MLEDFMSRCKQFLIVFGFLIGAPQLVSAAVSSEEMTVEEKVGQLLMVHFHGEECNEAAQQLIKEAHVGAIIYYRWANGLQSPQQIQKLSNGLQHYARSQRHAIPLLIAADQEGGRVNRLIEGFVVFPDNAVLAKTGRPEWVKAAAKATAEQMHAVGINMNLAPVVDINSNPDRIVMGMRSYGTSPEIVIRYGREALIGHREGNVIATLKHFPGYGDVAVDPHRALPVNNSSLQQLEQGALLPFQTLAPEAEAIMTAHLLVPALDPRFCATLSYAIVTGILRDKYKYKGVILTDSLVMEGVLKQAKSVEDAALLSFLAGHDILVLGGKLLDKEKENEVTLVDVLRIHQYLVAAVKSGLISQERLNASVNRILKLKETRGLFGVRDPGPETIERYVNTVGQQQLLREILSHQ
jgi:beta-N-acetylhexosaminidase